MEEIAEITQLVNSCIKLGRLVNYQLDMKPEKHISPNHWLFVYKTLYYIANFWSRVEKTVNSTNEAQMPNINKQHLEAVVKTLRPFKDALESLEEPNNATLHLVLVYLHDLKKTCEAKDTECKQYSFIKNLKKLLAQKLEKIVTENITVFHKLALFLYPPANKLLQFDDIEKKNIEEECLRLMKCFKTDPRTNIKEETDVVCNAAQSKRKKLFSDFVYSGTEKDSSELVKEELQIYKLTRVTDTEHFNVFDWWEQQQQHFPRLYKLSHTVLATPATSTAAQRIFASISDLLCDQWPEFYTNDIDRERIAFVKFNTDPDELDLRVLS